MTYIVPLMILQGNIIRTKIHKSIKIYNNLKPLHRVVSLFSKWYRVQKHFQRDYDFVTDKSVLPKLDVQDLKPSQGPDLVTCQAFHC